MRAPQLERNRFDEQRALLLLSGLSLTCREARRSGTFLIHTQIFSLATVFVECCLWGSTRVQRAVCLFVAAYPGVPKGSILSCSSFVRPSPTEAKPKIQGFTPTDKEPAVHLFSTRGENMKKNISRLSLCRASCSIPGRSLCPLPKNSTAPARKTSPPTQRIMS